MREYMHKRRLTQKAARQRIVLGPVPCKACRQPVTWNGWAWEDPTGFRHRHGSKAAA